MNGEGLLGFAVGVAAAFSLLIGPASASADTTSVSALAPTFQATEGTTFSGQLGTSAAGCRPATPGTASIYWGDGSAASAASESLAGTEVELAGSHVYAEEGTFSGTVGGYYVCDGDHVPVSASFVAHVADAALAVGAVSLPALRVGQQFSGTVTTFSDADAQATASDYSVGLNWGDGSATLATLTTGGDGRFAVSGAHEYATPGTYQVSVGIRDAGGSTVTQTGSITVAATQTHGLRLAGLHPLGDGTALLSLNLPGRGLLRISQAGARRPLLRGLRKRVSSAGALSVILRPTTSAGAILRHGGRLHVTADVTFKVAGGGLIWRHIPITLDYQICAAGMAFTYTGSEQACIVPHGNAVMHLLLFGAAGGSGPGGCGGFPSGSGGGGRGAQVDATRLHVDAQILYIEVGGNGGDASHDCIVEQGQAGAGGWNGGASGALPPSHVGSGGGGGATDVRTVSCAIHCSDAGGFGVFASLASRLVVAGGGGGGGSGGGAGDCIPCSTTGGGGGWAGFNYGSDGGAGGSASVSGTSAIAGVGGGGGTGNGAGDAGVSDPECGQSYDPPPCSAGTPGHLGIGGVGGMDPFVDLGAQPMLLGYAGGGGGGGYWGGGGGDGGLISQGNTIGGGGGGGAGSSFGPAYTYFSAAYQPAAVQIVSVG
ncbi:MAG TPA: PKD domain-containing protein [Solirubrobacteraceae bacterium]